MINTLAAESLFYSKDIYMSYSSLSKLLYSPVIFYAKYILKEGVDSNDPHLVNGKLLHCLLLEKENFENKFVVTPSKIPSKNALTVLNLIYSSAKNAFRENDPLESLNDIIISSLSLIGLHQSLTSDESRINKILTEENKNYYNYLQASSKKDIVSAEDYTRALEVVDLIKSNQKISSLLAINADFSQLESYSELNFECKLENYSFGLRGVIDNIQINHKEKVIYINDFKTTSKTLLEFPESIDYYKYWMQASIYIKLVQEKLKLDYKIKFHFIVIDKYNSTYAFEVSDKTLNEWSLKLKNVLDQAEYHISNRDFSLPYELAINDVIL